MGGKFIPNGDIDFATMAESFARAIAAEPARFEVSAADADALTAAVAAYRAALNTARGQARSMIVTKEKDLAREAAESIIRRLANAARANTRLGAADKLRLQLRERPARPKQQPCPTQPPMLRFVRALHEGGGAAPRHELAFIHRPEGAVRLELFVDLVPPDEAIPIHPGANHNGRPWYLRSFTRSPMVLAPPMARVPMRVVYWGRWADSSGAVGPFSETAVGWIEGGSCQHLPGGVGMAVPGGQRLAALMNHAPADEQGANRVEVMEAQYESLHVGSLNVAGPHAQLKIEAVSQSPARQLPAPQSDALTDRNVAHDEAA